MRATYLEGKGVVVLTDICANGPQLRAMTRRLEASGSGAWRCHGTPGRFCPADRRVRGGLIILWDENHFTAGELSKAAEVHIKGRLTEVTLQDKAGDMITIVGAYMPTRDKPEDTVRTPWEVLREVTSGRPGVIVAGDLNAELPEALARAGRTPPQYPTTADTLMNEMVEEDGLLSMGPDEATYTRGGVSSQLDWMLCDPNIMERVGRGKVKKKNAPLTGC